jgi:uncharacterized membrane protein
MKKLLFICLVTLWVATQTKAQMRDTVLNMNKHRAESSFLFQKSKKQKTAAWLLLGGGAGLITTGVIMIGGDKDPFGVVFGASSKATTGAILTVAGGAAMLGSIPLFIASGKNKSKASLMLKNENVFFNPQINIKKHLVSVGLKIK